MPKKMTQAAQIAEYKRQCEGLVAERNALWKELKAARAEAKTAPTLGELYGGDTEGGYAVVIEALQRWNAHSGDVRQTRADDTGVWVLGKLAKAVLRLADDVIDLEEENKRADRRYEQAWELQREAETLNSQYERSISRLVLQLHEQAERLQKYHKVNAKESRNV